MSTKAIREALARAEILGGREESEAWAELESIEKSAHLLFSGSQQYLDAGDLKRFGSALELMKTIADQTQETP